MCFRRGTVRINQGYIGQNVRKVWNRVFLHVKTGILVPAFYMEFIWLHMVFSLISQQMDRGAASEAGSPRSSVTAETLSNDGQPLPRAEDDA